MNTDKSDRFVRTTVLGIVLLVFVALGGGMWVILNRGEELGLNKVVEQPEVYGTDRSTVEQLLRIPSDLAVTSVEYEFIEAADVPRDERQFLAGGRRAMVVALHVDPEASPALDAMKQPLAMIADQFDATMPRLRTPCLPERYFNHRGSMIARQPNIWGINLSWFGATGWQELGWAVYDGEDEAVYIYRVVLP